MRLKYTKEGNYLEDVKISIPFKLIGMHETLENIFYWIVPENPFDENDEPRGIEKGNSETYIDKIKCIVEKTSDLNFDTSSLGNT